MELSNLQSEGGKYPGILCGTLLVPQDIVMDVNNIMKHYSGMFPYYIIIMDRIN